GARHLFHSPLAFHFRSAWRIVGRLANRRQVHEFLASLVAWRLADLPAHAVRNPANVRGVSATDSGVAATDGQGPRSANLGRQYRIMAGCASGLWKLAAKLVLGSTWITQYSGLATFVCCGSLLWPPAARKTRFTDSSIANVVDPQRHCR